jgi:hypothetical protein
MRQVSNTAPFRQIHSGIVLAIVSALLIACHGSNADRAPALQITRVPVASPGGPELLDYIAGRANGARPGQQVVLYARSGIWWVQPFGDQEFTKIQPDSTWKNSTHLGTEYAALLVEPGYHPEPRLVALPQAGNGVLAVVVVKGSASAPIVPKVIHFSGYDWTVRAAGNNRGGEPNAYDPANAWVDQKGYMHLRMQEHGGRWSCAEVSLNRSLGYGSYRFVVQDTSHLPPSAVVGMFTWDDVTSFNFHNELDIELSRWGSPSSKNAQYVVQPFYVPENVARFEVPAGVLTYTFRWEPGMVSFQTVRGSSAGPSAANVNEHVFTSDVPAPAGETVHMDLYDYHHSRSTSQQPSEVVIEKFEYLP